MAQITKHFTWREATHSDTAERKGLKNDPPVTAQGAIEVAAEGMEAVRSICGDQPIQVTSWYRSPEVNAAVGGSPTSDHITGYAVDFRAVDRNALTCARAIEASPLIFDQLIWYPGQNRLHISFAPGNRREVLTKTKGGYAPGLVEP
ncbi:MAG: D-Ala-D-Ala carboxypeptidase family metallohydrolase [Oceanicaulis sp.]